MILNAFRKYLNKDLSIYSRSTVVSQVDGSTNTTFSLKKVVKGAYYEGSSAAKFISEKFRANVTGVFIISPADLNGTQILDTDEIQMNGISYKIIHADNVMLQDEVIVVMV